MVWFLGKVWKCQWEKFVCNWEILELLCKTLKLCLEKCSWENPVGNIPAQISWESFVGHVGNILSKCSCGQLVWNIGKILKLLLGKTFVWESLWTHEKYHLGKTCWKLGKFHLGKFHVRNFGISYLGKSWCPCFAEQKVEKLFIWKIFEFWLGKFYLGRF